MADRPLSEYLGRMPVKWFNEDGTAKVESEQFHQTIDDIRVFFKSDAGKALRGDWRAKMTSFTIKNGYVPDGMTNVDAQGTYVVGTRPNTPKDLLKRSKRVIGEQIYSRSLVAGANKVIEEVGFKHQPNEDYPTRTDALLAIEFDSLSSKGPYDNGEWDTAIKTVDTVLSNSWSYKPIPDYLFQAWETGLNRRYSEYEGKVDRGISLNVSEYVDYMQARGLSRTMRGFPFYASGNSTLRKQHYHTTLLMFKTVAGFKFTAKDAETFVGKVTVDEFIQTVLVHLFDELHLPMSAWYSLFHAIIIPISRDQGSPYKCEWKDNKLQWTGERKDRKYRLVTPISGFVQATLIMASRSLVKVAPSTEGRIGLQDPVTNVDRMNRFIHHAEELERVLISTDFSAYDSTLPAQLMGSMCAMYSFLFDDPMVSDALAMAGVVACQKIMVLPTATGDRGRPYDHFDNIVLNEIKGDRHYAIKSSLSQIKGKSLKDELRRSEEEFDWMARAFYVCQGYLPSGLILTNTLGSDCTLLMSRELVPAHLESSGVFPSGTEPYHAIGSGDDCVQEVPKPVYDRIGYEKLLVQIEAAYAAIGMQVNAKKQLKIKLKGYPLVDFLQNVYTQFDTAERQEPYSKFLRQAPSLPYKERYSSLYQVLQWVIVHGKLDSALCRENLEFAAHVFGNAGLVMNAEAQKRRYRPPVPSNWIGERNKLFYNPDFDISSSVYGGMEQYMGLVKKYGQDVLGELVRYDLGRLDPRKLIDEFDSELETRAPHRVQLAKQVFSALGDEVAEAAGEDERFEGHGSYVSLIPDFFRLLEEFSGVSVTPQELDQPKLRGGVQPPDGVDVGEEAQQEADDYEIG